jgi:hypothetical protein
MAIFEPKNKIENQYKASLRNLFKGLYQFILDDNLDAVLNSKSFSYFCNTVASRMVTGTMVENAKDWREASRQGMQSRLIYEALQKEMQGPIGYKVQSLIDENAQLIKSFSGTMANQIVRDLNDNSQAGVRSTVYAEKLRKWAENNDPDISESRIVMIARTETSKASTALTRARAENLGLNWYVWRTSEDFRVRSSHKIMDGVLICWSNAPSPEQLDNIKSSLGHYHAGNCPNCRCYPEPVVSLKLLKFPVKVYTGGKIVRMGKAEFDKLNGVLETEWKEPKQLEIREIKPVAIEEQKKQVQFTTKKKENIEIFRKEAEALGYPITTESKSKTSSIAIAFKPADTPNGKIYLNPNSEWIKHPHEVQERMFKSGYLSSPDPMATLHHETAHLKFNAPDNFMNNRERDIIGEQVSKYARINPKEFVSEVYGAMQTGKTFSEEIMFLFNRYAVKK